MENSAILKELNTIDDHDRQVIVTLVYIAETLTDIKYLLLKLSPPTPSQSTDEPLS